MKPWSKESQDGLKTLLRFYKEKSFALPYCPLCVAVGYSPTIGPNACRKCPWVIMTNRVCFSIGRVTPVVAPDVLRVRVSCSLEGCELSKEDFKAIDKRINQLEEWIQYYDNFKEEECPTQE